MWQRKSYKSRLKKNSGTKYKSSHSIYVPSADSDIGTIMYIIVRCRNQSLFSQEP